MPDSQLSASTAILLGASVATTATLLVLFATGALSVPGRDETEQPETGHKPAAGRNGYDKDKSSWLNRSAHTWQISLCLESSLIYLNCCRGQRAGEALRDGIGRRFRHLYSIRTMTPTNWRCGCACCMIAAIQCPQTGVPCVVVPCSAEYSHRYHAGSKRSRSFTRALASIW